jgi:hypothetical protein
MPKSLLSFASNIHSQNGEDGILAEILRRLGIHSGWFVEFGAWDGKNMSNTRHLAEQGWSGVFIEGNAGKFAELQRNVKPLSGAIQCLNAWVAASGPDSLDNLLSRTDLPARFEVLSIDIDSNDYFVWQSLKDYSPAIVIIEINSGFPAHLRRTHRSGAIRTGSSFRSTLELGMRKGYTLVCHTGNMIFVKNELAVQLDLPADEIAHPESLFVDTWTKQWVKELPYYIWLWLKRMIFPSRKHP